MASIARTALLRQTGTFAASASRLPTRANPLLSKLSQQAVLRPQLLHNGTRIAAFHASSRRSLIPPGPQVIHGGVNDPAPIPPTSPSHGSYHWTFERLLAAALVPLTITPFAAGTAHPALDALLCATLLVHSHLGLQASILDYVPKRRFPGLHRLSMWALNAATVLVGVGLYEFETNDVGLAEAIKRVWKA